MQLPCACCTLLWLCFVHAACPAPPLHAGVLPGGNYTIRLDPGRERCPGGNGYLSALPGSSDAVMLSAAVVGGGLQVWRLVYQGTPGAEILERPVPIWNIAHQRVPGSPTYLVAPGAGSCPANARARLAAVQPACPEEMWKVMPTDMPGKYKIVRNDPSCAYRFLAMPPDCAQLSPITY